MRQPVVRYGFGDSIIITYTNIDYDIERYRSNVERLLSRRKISKINFGEMDDDEYYPNLNLQLFEDIFDILEKYPVEKMIFRSHYSYPKDISNFTILLDMIYHSSSLFEHFKELSWYVYGKYPITITDEYLDDFATAVAKFGLIDPSHIPSIYIGDWRGPDVMPKIINAAIERKIAENKQNKGNLNTVIYALVNPLTTLNLPGLPEEVWLKIGKEATGIDYGIFHRNPTQIFGKK